MMEEYDHKAMMLDPNRWPQWPVLPVKQFGSGFPECGVMVESDGIQPKVYLTNLFALDLANAEVKEYEDIDELLADGWVVD
jgi:hypothetical protein